MREINEYEYLQYLVQTRYLAEVESQVDPMFDQSREQLLKGNFAFCGAIEESAKAIQQQLYDKQIRAENIIRWLKLDTQLRQDGKAYADIMENPEPIAPFDPNNF